VNLGVQARPSNSKRNMVGAMLANAQDWAETLVWPSVAVFLAILAVVALATNAGREFRNWLRDRLRGVEVFGVRVELTEQASRETRTTINEAFDVIRSRLRREFDDAARGQHLAEMLERIVEAVLPSIIAANPGAKDLNLRATMYIEDALLREYLYQLLDYYPGPSGRRGRYISERLGIVGQAWRSSRTQVEGNVPVEPLELIERWGMTAQEARAAGQGRKSFLAIPVFEEAPRVGILFMDAVPSNVFGNGEDEIDKRDEILGAIKNAIETTDVASRLAAVRREVFARAPRIALEPDSA
jgi:hypothetical protein